MKRSWFAVLPLPSALALILGLFLFVAGLRFGLASPARTVTFEGDLSPPTARLGETAPDFSLGNVTGSSVQLSDFSGQPVILFFWASWCRFCEADMPKLASVYEEYGSQGLTVLAINIMEPLKDVQDYVARTGLTLPVLLDSDAAVSRQYNVRAMPTYFFIDRAGVIQSRIIGEARPSLLRAQVRLIVGS